MQRSSVGATVSKEPSSLGAWQLAAQLPFPGWGLPRKYSLPLDEVQRIYERVDWSTVEGKLNDHDREYGEYGKRIPISMCKALALPYFVFIPSLTELARRLEEYESYRVLCGFLGRPPTRAMLWHFQNAPLLKAKQRKREGKLDTEQKTWFYGVLYEILIRATLWGVRLGIELPFRIDSNAIQTAVSATRLVKGVLKLSGRPNLRIQYDHPIDCKFPISVRVYQSNNLIDSYSLWPPPWWSGQSTEGVIESNISESRSYQQYTACSAIIVAEDGRILLGKRKAGYKPGFFALPGGRWRSGETLRECIEREVKEETGMQIVDPHPVSISFNRYDDAHQECWSVGVKVTKFKGSAAVKEPDKCESWQWYSLNSLPTPLFRPSQIIIEDYRDERFSALSWGEIEDWIDSTQQDYVEPISVAQPRLF